MRRELELKDFTDGKLYHKNDMVKVGCNDCAGCSSCCQDMGNSIILDPFDVFQLTTNLSVSFEELMKDKISLHLVDGVILPSLHFIERSTSNENGHEICPFLNQEGRCSIHDFRPGFCRLFPLGRYYVNNSFHYILQDRECPKENKTKVKVQKWIDLPSFSSYEKFVNDWHYFLLKIETLLETSQNEEEKKTLHMHLLHTFYLQPYAVNSSNPTQKTETFYFVFAERLHKLEPILFSNL